MTPPINRDQCISKRVDLYRRIAGNGFEANQEAEASFQKALLLPDRMLSYHFTRLAKSQAKQ